MKNLREEIINLRRNAYVEAVIRSTTFDDVVGYIGRKIPLELLYGFDLFVLPVDSTDREILSYSEEKNLCPLIDATYTYARTDKCPLIHSSKIIVMDDSCEEFKRKMTSVLGEKVLSYVNDKKLICDLTSIYNKTFNLNKKIKAQEKLKEINILLDRLAGTNISSRFLYEIEFYLKFIFDLDERIRILEKINNNYKSKGNKRQNIFVPRGIQLIDYIDENFENYRICEGGMCVGEVFLGDKDMDVDYKYCSNKSSDKLGR